MISSREWLSNVSNLSKVNDDDGSTSSWSEDDFGFPFEIPDGNQEWPLCPHCYVLFTAPKHNDMPSCEPRTFRRSYTQMIEAAVNVKGCNLCRELLTLVYRYERDGTGIMQQEIYRKCGEGSAATFPLDDWLALLPPLKEGKIDDALDFQCFVKHITWDTLYFRLFNEDDDTASYSVKKALDDPSRYPLQFDVTARFDSAATTYMPTPTIETDAFDERMSEQMNRMLQACLQKHPKCKITGKTIENFLSTIQNTPCYLLDVSRPEPYSPDIIKLVSGKLEDGYAILSYRRPVSPELMDALDRHKLQEKGIEMKNLPMTIQNGIEVARRFSFGYLWVDFLCSEQESPEVLASIYLNSLLTIVAASASSLEDGFLQERRRPARLMKMPFSLGLRQPSKMYISRKTHFTGHTRAVEPIDASAWAFQEQFLSQRVIRFNLFDVGFLCCENSTSIHGHVQGGISVRSPLSMPDDWRKIIEQYSYKQLTNPADKLPAISAVAAYFVRQIQSEYLAGLWRSDLVRQLCWFSSNLLRQKQWRAPTWSPMAVDGVIKYVTINQSFKPAVEVVKASTTKLDQQLPYGQVTDGWITLEGPVSYIPPEPKSSWLDESQLNSPAMQDYIRKDSSAHWDILYNEDGSLDYSDWQDAKRKGYYHVVIGGSYGLLLKKRADGKYVRIGLARDSFWYSDEKNLGLTEEYIKEHDFVTTRNGETSLETITIV